MAHGYPDWEGGKSGLYLMPEWAAREGNDRRFRAADTNKAFGEFASDTHVVDAGKTLYIVFLSFSIAIDAAADYDHFAHAIVSLRVNGIRRIETGGDTGGGFPISPPVVVLAGETLESIIFNNSNINCTLELIVLGYEI